ncbi:MAG: calcium-translocating P-type ATPase, SERCA-type [Syntrophomonadaceae bacterium]|nr:calcium-translocating P-type ATPase, SERCA-type [Syntrophomonadaceae bacterium]
MSDTDWHFKRITEVAQICGTDISLGLSERAALKKLDTGRNAIAGLDKPRPLAMLVSQFTDTMVLVLLGAAVLSGILGDLLDAGAILIIVLINGLLGFIQEYRAEKSLEEIKKLSSPFAIVVREGKKIRISAEELVTGDLVLLEAGDKVPADMRLFEVNSLEIEESSLTGESEPVLKSVQSLPAAGAPLGDRFNMAFMGTAVTRGRGRGIVVATGLQTVMGEIARLIARPSEQTTPLQKRLDSLGKVLIVICLCACLAVMMMGIYRGENLVRMVMAGISLAVAAIPEGLPAIVTVVLALGVQRMARRKAIVRKLPAVETLGCTTVICSDKTGTLTQNQMTVRKLYTAEQEVLITGEGYKPEGLFIGEEGEIKPLRNGLILTALEIGSSCNHAEIIKDNNQYTVQGDPTEGALLVMGRKAGIRNRAPILREAPFDSERKMMSVVIKTDQGYRILSKGALDTLLGKCTRILTSSGEKPLRASHRQLLTEKQEEWARDSMRVLALAYRDISGAGLSADDERLESGLCLAGICGMIDPPRTSAKIAVEDCRQAGIVPIMITGDHPVTALAVARQTGISEGSSVIGPDEIDHLSPRELAEQALQIRVFARVSPQHKLKIVQALKRQGHVVAMTGDGVNDAPALKEADIGVAMGISGTEVTREAADMVLADDDFSTIVVAVHEGRGIYDNIRKFIRYLLGGNIGEILTMFLASLMGMPLPLLPLQILWVNLVTDGLPAMALGLEPPEPDVMQRKPRPPGESIFSNGLGWHLLGRGAFIGLSTLFVLIIGLAYSGVTGQSGLELARTMALTNLVLAQLLYVFDCRSEKHSPFELGFFSNPFLLGAVGCSVTMHLLVLYSPTLNRVFGTTPLEAWSWMVILAVAGAGILIKWGIKQSGKVLKRQDQYVKLENIRTHTA